MENMMKWAATWVADMTETHTSETVRYKRAAHFVDVPASVGETEQDVQEEDGVTLTVTKVDWDIAAAKLILDGAVTLPEVGDLIEHVIGSKTYTYKVLPVEGEERHWRYTEHITKSRIRVHSKLVAES